MMKTKHGCFANILEKPPIPENQAMNKLCDSSYLGRMGYSQHETAGEPRVLDFLMLLRNLSSFPKSQSFVGGLLFPCFVNETATTQKDTGPNPAVYQTWP